MTEPLVSVIMPTANRAHFLPRAIDNFLKQDYENKELVIISKSVLDIPNQYYFKLQDSDNGLIHIYSSDIETIDFKRNMGAKHSNGSIILHMDDDDFYASGWISKSVEHLLSTKAELTGLSSAHFLKTPDKALKYTFNTSLPPHKPYVIGASMCYFKSYWEKHTFRLEGNRKNGEDWHFCMDGTNIIPHDYINGFVATIHGANSSSHHSMNSPEFQAVGLDIIKDIMGNDFNKYATTP